MLANEEEVKLDSTEEYAPEEPKSQKPNDEKFVAVVQNENGEVQINVGALTIDEAYILMIKGKAKFDKIYAKWIDENIK